MSITKRIFDILPDGKVIDIYKLTGKGDAYVEILTYGGIIRSIVVPDKFGNMGDVLVGFESHKDYLETADAYYGALIGRVANRIAGASFELNGTTYDVAKNDGQNHLHGGFIGFNSKIWNAKIVDDSLELSIISEDGEENYPGRLEVTVVYKFSRNNTLSIIYNAVSDKDTVVNMTNHAYFNLSGHDFGSIYDHTFQLDADTYTVSDKYCTPTGEIAKVEGTLMDFRTPKRIGDGLMQDTIDADMIAGGGYDHNFVLNKPLNSYKKIGTLSEDIKGRYMDVFTDKPGIQLYTGNFIHGDTVGKDGCVYKRRGALCLETQFYPDAVHHPEWPSPILRANEKYKYTTSFSFGVSK